MSSSFPLFPPNASSVATEMDLLYLFIVAVCAFFTVLVSALVVVFAIKYRRRHPDEVGHDIHGSLALEIVWTIIPLVLSLVMFGWGADLFFRLAKPPRDSMEIFVVGKQWMWKVQHPEGVREINELHVPIDRNIRLTMGSEDVLHDFSIPAFRVKMDVVPGKLTTMWFRATEAGHLSPVLRRILRHEALGDDRPGHRDDAAGLRSVAAPAAAPWAAPRPNGERLFSEHACVTCHKPDFGRPRADALRSLRQQSRARRRPHRRSPTRTTCASRS